MASRAHRRNAHGRKRAVNASVGEVFGGAPSRYTLNLDLPPKTRWVHIVENYKHLYAELVNIMWSSFDDTDPAQSRH